MDFQSYEVGTVVPPEQAMEVTQAFDELRWKRSCPHDPPKVLVKRSNGDWCVAEWIWTNDYADQNVWLVEKPDFEKSIPRYLQSELIRMPTGIN